MAQSRQDRSRAVQPSGRLEIPPGLRQNLRRFRRRLWRIKLLEAFGLAASAVLAGFLVVFVADRLGDTSGWFRGAVLLASLAACGAIPFALRRWVWRRRRFDQLARLLTRTCPEVGGPLLGIVELSGSRREQARSPELVAAAIRQVADQVARRDLASAVPDPRHTQRLGVAFVLAGIAIGMWWFAPPAAVSSWKRLLMPLGSIPRYAFASLEPTPKVMVVPSGEPVEFAVSLSPAARWRPDSASLSWAGKEWNATKDEEGRYRFRLPGLVEVAEVRVRVGDCLRRVQLRPMLRPELTQLAASIDLPRYLRRDRPLRQDVRGRTVTAVLGSRVTVSGRASRTLSELTIDGRRRAAQTEDFASRPVRLGEPTEMTLQWRDALGLTGKEAFRLRLEPLPDAPPSVTCDDLPSEQVILDSEVVSFHVFADDDFGVRRVGYEWSVAESEAGGAAAGNANSYAAEGLSGERILGAGGPETERLELAGTFEAAEWGIDPQPISLRLFVEDYFPGRGRVYSKAYRFNLLAADEHAGWIAEQLARWRNRSLDVRDQELRLHERNKSLRQQASDNLLDPGLLKALADQALQERANGRALEELVRQGEGLLREAMRNPEISADELQRWAETMGVVKEIADRRMPSVADLLEQASESAASVGGNDPDRNAVGKNRLRPAPFAPSAEKSAEDDDADQPAPSIVDVESSQQSRENPSPEQAQSRKGQSESPRMSLPRTMLAGGGAAKPESSSAPESLDQAVEEQADLLSEFEKVSEELEEVLAKLDRSTLVKRLKAASRAQQSVARELSSLVTMTFGLSQPVAGEPAEKLQKLARTELRESRQVANLIDDMAAYFRRGRYLRFGEVLDEMRVEDVAGELRGLVDELPRRPGLALAQTEYWSDTLDRWAENLVEVGQAGESSDSTPTGSLPPTLILEVLRVLESEVALREQTRVAQQARDATPVAEHSATALGLAESQEELRTRVDQVVSDIGELPEGLDLFGSEVSMLQAVSEVMIEARDLLATGETGAPAIAAQTQAIELMLQSNRFNPSGGGGGGGAQPGGGGGGGTAAEALALVGSGMGARVGDSDSTATHTTAAAGTALPEEFRSGLNTYFGEIERWISGPESSSAPQATRHSVPDQTERNP